MSNLCRAVSTLVTIDPSFDFSKATSLSVAFQSCTSLVNFPSAINAPLVTSFEYAPFHTFTDLRVPDNWRKNKRYYNVPLDAFYEGLKGALRAGYSAAIDGDISEPGRVGERDIAFIPDDDIPPALITQEAREHRFREKMTTDDPLMHIVGMTESGGHDWFLVKDSWRDAWEGRHKGYFFYRGDFAKLKILAYLVHKEAVPASWAQGPLVSGQLLGH